MQLLSQYSADPMEQVTEVVYQHGIQNLSQTNNEIIMSANITEAIGPVNVSKIQQRFSFVPFYFQI